ncbi:MAG: HTH domain-containing protein [Elusimicrobia bacterium]|nr:HTH domain-containing protein [Elusimicrobiota bacterium]MDY5729475.1 HTH domain-containing protein [Elusimicrobiaceae bacterium]MDY6129434.1 HTH domain-containing protein [Elusimicrobiaceae bacterium]
MSKEIVSKTKRMADILALLEQSAVNMPALVEKLGVSKRTLQRDLRLMQEAGVPVVSPKQSVYAFVDGFSCRRVRVSPMRAALQVTAYEVAKQCGVDFRPTTQEVRALFAPKDSEKCQTAKTADFEPQFGLNGQMIFNACEKHQFLRITLPKKRSLTIRPYQVWQILGRWYVVSMNASGEMSRYAVDEISACEPQFNPGSYVPAEFTPIPFALWPIWKMAHTWLNQDIQKQVLLAKKQADDALMSQKQKMEQVPAAAAPAPSEQVEKTASKTVSNLPQNAPAVPQNPAETESQNHDLSAKPPVLPPKSQINS